MTTPMVSVIINCYNSECFLREAIDSVIAQTFQDWELIFWDNQSTDGSANVVKSYDDPRINYYYAPEHTNLGQGRINALEKAKCEWVSFLDADDFWFPAKLEKQISLISGDSDIGLIYSNTYIDVFTNANAHPIRKYRIVPQKFLNEPLKYLLRGNFIPWLTIMFNRQKLLQCGGLQNYAFAVDYDMCLKLVSSAKIIHIPEFLSVYRIHGDNMSVGNKEIGYSDSWDIIMKYKELSDFKVGAACHIIRCMVLYLTNGQPLKASGYLRQLITYKSAAIEAISFLIWYKFKDLFTRNM